MSNYRKNFIEGKHYKIDSKSGCWIWLQSLNTKGYATTSIKSIAKLASRIFYKLHCGKIKRGLVIDHLCRNPKCVNPKHLEVVTYAENTRRGDLTKLTPEDVVEIRKAKGRTQQEMAISFGVSQSEISRIINHKHYIL